MKKDNYSIDDELYLCKMRTIAYHKMIFLKRRRIEKIYGRSASYIKVDFVVTLEPS